jgi:hypothetical protein
MTAEEATSQPRKGRGGRPKSDPSAVRAATIGVRVSPAEYEALKAKASRMGMTPAQFLREAALSRRLPQPPVPQVNREQYAELARLASNLNQLVRLSNSGRPVTVDDSLLRMLADEVGRLRLALIGAGGGQ